jgi:cobalamin biosynthesis Mg chelatase CobN
LKASELDVLYKTALDFRDQVPNAMPIVSQAMKTVHDAFVAEEKAISFEYVAEKAEMKYLQWKRSRRGT